MKQQPLNPFCFWHVKEPHIAVHVWKHDVADTIREALERYDEETRSRAKHLLWLAQQENEALRKKLAQHTAEPINSDVFPNKLE